MLIMNLMQNPVMLLVFLIGLVVAITIHEYAHAYAAYRCGDPTAKYMGRLSFNPLAHLDPLGTIFLFLVGFGWGKPVPTNPNNYSKRSDEIYVALAGIFANLIVATVLAIPIRIASLKGISVDSNVWLAMLSIIVDMNIILAAFNILPFYPLDGSHVVEYFMSEDTLTFYHTYSPYALLGILILDRIGNTLILYTIMEPLIRIFSLICKGTFSIFL